MRRRDRTGLFQKSFEGYPRVVRVFFVLFCRQGDEGCAGALLSFYPVGFTSPENGFGSQEWHSFGCLVLGEGARERREFAKFDETGQALVSDLTVVPKHKRDTYLCRYGGRGREWVNC